MKSALPTLPKIYACGPMLVIEQASKTVVFKVPDDSLYIDVAPSPTGEISGGYDVRIHKVEGSSEKPAHGILLSLADESAAVEMQKLLGRAVRKMVKRRHKTRRSLTWLLSLASVLGTLSIIGAYRVIHSPQMHPQVQDQIHTMSAAQPLRQTASSLPAPLMGLPPSPSLPPSQIAPLLHKGVAVGKYSLQLGKISGGKSPLYVFEDPQCIHCQAFAPELEKLAQTHQVFVFPVSVIGGQSSANLSGLVLCAKPADRERSWLLAQSGALLISPNSSAQKKPSEDCLKAVGANDAMFSALKLPGTPTLFDTSGNMMPLTVEHTAAAVDGWLTEASK